MGVQPLLDWDFHIESQTVTILTASLISPFTRNADTIQQLHGRKVGSAEGKTLDGDSVRSWWAYFRY